MTKSYYPIEWNHYVNDSKKVRAVNKKFNAVTNRQNLKPTYIPNGSIYVFKYDTLKKTRQYYTKKTYAYIMPFEKSVDIDDVFDFELAKKLLKKDNNK